jgi:hypothetical protein
LGVLSEIERITLLLRHGEGLSIDQIQTKLSRLMCKRYRRHVVLDDLREGEIVLDEELQRRGLLGSDPPEE